MFPLLWENLKCIICVSEWGNSLCSLTLLPNSEFPKKWKGQHLTSSFTDSCPLCFHAHETASPFTHKQLKLLYGFDPKLLTLLSLTAHHSDLKSNHAGLLQISDLWRFVATS